ncbi:MAG: rod shape-determining protein MreC [Rhodobacteraceae bacterium]|nr:rod shape-determining protein MreC [Paracoccaceae bacterium]
MSKSSRQSRYSHPQKRRNLRRGLAIWLVFLAAMILISDRQQKSMLASGRLSTDDISSKVMGVFAYPVRGIETLFAQSKDRSRAYEDNKALKEQVERLRGYENMVRDLELRVRRFEEILDMNASSDVPEHKIVTRVVNESNGPFVHSALINVGRNKEIEVGHAVMSVEGLYGHVVRVGSVSARVLLLNDLSSRLSVMSQRSQSRAILVGRNADQPQLDYVSPIADWQAGDRVVTSGDGGVLPRGLVIGVVSQQDGGPMSVRLFTQGQPIDWVWVLPYTPIQPPEEISEIEANVSAENGSADQTPSQDQTLSQEQAPSQEELQP